MTADFCHTNLTLIFCPFDLYTYMGFGFNMHILRPTGPDSCPVPSPSFDLTISNHIMVFY